MTWFWLALISVCSLATAELTQQHLLNKKEAYTERTSAVLTFLVEWILSIPIVLIFFSNKQIFGWFNAELMVRIPLVTFLASFGMVLYLRSFKVKSISFSLIFGSASVPVATALGIIFLNESADMIKLFGIILILLAIVGLNYRNLHLEKNHFYGLVSGLIFGVCFTLDKTIVRSLNPFIYIFWSFFLVSLFGFLLRPKEVINSVRGSSLIKLRPVMFSGIAYFAYNALTFSAYRSGGDVGSVDAINNTAVFLVIAFEFIVMAERHSLFRKIITAAVAYSGILLLALSK